MKFLTLAAFLLLACPLLAQNKLRWVPDADVAFEAATEEGSVIFVSIGFVGEARSEEIRKRVFADKAVIAQAARTINVPAWTWAIGDERRLPDFGKAEALDHSANLARATSEWISVNALGTFAAPQHLWLNGAGEVLLSVPWELDADEMSWCFDEALRLAAVEDRPAPTKKSHPPRRLLFGAVTSVLDDDDLGRGLTDDELEPTMKRLKRGYVTARNRDDIGRIMFTANEDGAEFLGQQIDIWALGGSSTSGIIDFVYGLIGLVAPVEFLELLESKVGSPRASLRAIIAVGYEQIGHPDGLKAVKKALKSEKDEVVRPEWVRALGACASRDKSVAKQLIKFAERDDNSLVQLNAVLALGHVLPQPDARDWLIEMAETAIGERQCAAALALALGRERSAIDTLKKLRGEVKLEASIAAFDSAIKVLEGANLFELEDAVRAIDGSDLPRPRLFYRPKFDIPESGEESGEGEG
ncbi:MAG: HEAT repeat domain-containing protein [Planctomycetes bacterium]|nr:HEAT repeat domain-containing protein [Planctomycetota bacterium]